MASAMDTPEQTGQTAPISLWRTFRAFWPRFSDDRKKREYSRLPCTTTSRRLQSLTDAPTDLISLSQILADHASKAEETVLYLAYGSNLSAETFRGVRGIKPLSQVNVLVPELALTFDLPGNPYTEPCFTNTRYRQIPYGSTMTEKAGQIDNSDYHKDRWHKGLVGVVYEVTMADYAHIIATEGGGIAYQDVIIDCYALDSDPRKEIPVTAEGIPFKAHTLLSPGLKLRPDPSYAQPSARYLKLITDGAEECALPYEYQTFLHAIRTYRMTTTKQRLGQFIFFAFWSPIVSFIFLGGGRLFLDKNGRYPAWYANFAAATVAATWGSYDDFFKPLFGDGERTIEGGDEETEDMDKEALLAKPRRQAYRALAKNDVGIV